MALKSAIVGSERVFELLDEFVDIDYQGLGIGSKLIDYVDNKYNKLELAVYKENESAVKFYKKKSFKIIDEQKNEDSGFYEYVMEK